jgi:23S rRNA pseudouridine2605 synthase
VSDARRKTSAPRAKARGARAAGSRSRDQGPLPAAAAPVAAARIRIQRVLARAGVASRRKADELVAAGRVRVNGAPALVGQTVDPRRDLVTVDGLTLGRQTEEPAWLVLHKPAGVLTTARDERGADRRTVFDLIPASLRRPGLTYVGRLDYMTEGILLLTTDGSAAHRLTHPSHAVERTYVATVRGNAVAAARELRRGIELEDGPVRATAVAVHPDGNRRWQLELTLTEGRSREVRRACIALGLRVERLVRTRFGPIQLGTLAAGAVRPLTRAERLLIAETT